MSNYINFASTKLAAPELVNPFDGITKLINDKEEKRLKELKYKDEKEWRKNQFEYRKQKDIEQSARLDRTEAQKAYTSEVLSKMYTAKTNGELLDIMSKISETGGYDGTTVVNAYGKLKNNLAVSDRKTESAKLLQDIAKGSPKYNVSSYSDGNKYIVDDSNMNNQLAMSKLYDDAYAVKGGKVDDKFIQQLTNMVPQVEGHQYSKYDQANVLRKQIAGLDPSKYDISSLNNAAANLEKIADSSNGSAEIDYRDRALAEKKRGELATYIAINGVENTEPYQSTIKKYDDRLEYINRQITKTNRDRDKSGSGGSNNPTKALEYLNKISTLDLDAFGNGDTEAAQNKYKVLVVKGIDPKAAFNMIKSSIGKATLFDTEMDENALVNAKVFFDKLSQNQKSKPNRLQNQYNKLLDEKEKILKTLPNQIIDSARTRKEKFNILFDQAQNGLNTLDKKTTKTNTYSGGSVTPDGKIKLINPYTEKSIYAPTVSGQMYANNYDTISSTIPNSPRVNVPVKDKIKNIKNTVDDPDKLLKEIKKINAKRTSLYRDHFILNGHERDQAGYYEDGANRITNELAKQEYIDYQNSQNVPETKQLDDNIAGLIDSIGKMKTVVEDNPKAANAYNPIINKNTKLLNKLIEERKIYTSTPKYTKPISGIQSVEIPTPYTDRVGVDTIKANNDIHNEQFKTFTEIASPLAGATRGIIKHFATKALDKIAAKRVEEAVERAAKRAEEAAREESKKFKKGQPKPMLKYNAVEHSGRKIYIPPKQPGPTKDISKNILIEKFTNNIEKLAKKKQHFKDQLNIDQQAQLDLIKKVNDMLPKSKKINTYSDLLKLRFHLDQLAQNPKAKQKTIDKLKAIDRLLSAQ